MVRDREWSAKKVLAVISGTFFWDITPPPGGLNAKYLDADRGDGIKLRGCFGSYGYTAEFCMLMSIVMKDVDYISG
jgi:hypothetical protein